MAIKDHDFIQLDYTGKLDDGTVFDTTEQQTAVNAGIAKQNAVFAPAVICVGESHILKGIDKALIGKELGKFSITIEQQDAFGKKDAKLLKLIPMKVFRKEKLNPFPGLEVRIDEKYGIVRTVSGGRVIVDFNHPLASRSLKYDINVLSLVTDTTEKLKAVIKNEFHVELKFELIEEKVVFEEQLPSEVLELVRKRILELVPEVKDVLLKEKTEPKADLA